MTELSSTHETRGRGDSEDLAIRVFEWIVADVDRIIQFLNVTGLQPETLRESAKSSHFLLGVLDYVTKDDELLKKIHEELSIRPDTIMADVGHLASKPETTMAAERKPENLSQLPRRSLFR